MCMTIRWWNDELTLTQFHGGNMKSEEEAENLWMKDFWNRIDTVQNVWKKVDQFIKCQI